MNIEVEGGRDVGVTQEYTDCFVVAVALNTTSSKRVTESVELDWRDTERFHHPLIVRAMTIANHKKILDHIKANFSFRALGIYLCLTTGLRIGEICALRWDDINVQNGTLQVKRTIERIYIIDGDKKHTELVINDPKTPNSVREIPLSAEALSLIKPLMKVVNTDFYVISNDRKPIEPRTYRSYYKGLMKSLSKLPRPS